MLDLFRTRQRNALSRDMYGIGLGCTKHSQLPDILSDGSMCFSFCCSNMSCLADSISIDHGWGWADLGFCDQLSGNERWWCSNAPKDASPHCQSPLYAWPAPLGGGSKDLVSQLNSIPSRSSFSSNTVSTSTSSISTISAIATGLGKGKDDSCSSATTPTPSSISATGGQRNSHPHPLAQDLAVYAK